MRQLGVFLLCALVAGALAAETNELAIVRQVGPGKYAVGAVTLSSADRSLAFPAKVNMTNGLVEYWLVHESGKVHESIFATEVRANDIHVGALLLSNAQQATNAQVTAFGTEKPVQIRVSWKNPDGKSVSYSAEEVVQNLQTKTTMSKGAWSYNGSRIVEGTFIAHRDGSLIAIMADPDALVNNPRPGRENDEIWQIRTNLLPSLGTNVEITMTFEASKKP